MKNRSNTVFGFRFKVHPEKLIRVTFIASAMLCGCQTSSRNSANDLDVETRLKAAEIRLDRIDEELATTRAYTTGEYVVRRGDVASMIAGRFDLTLDELAALNPDIQWNRVRVGMRLKISKQKESGKPK